MPQICFEDNACCAIYWRLFSEPFWCSCPSPVAQLYLQTLTWESTSSYDFKGCLASCEQVRTTGCLMAFQTAFCQILRPNWYFIVEIRRPFRTSHFLLVRCRCHFIGFLYFKWKSLASAVRFWSCLIRPISVIRISLFWGWTSWLANGHSHLA